MDNNRWIKFQLPWNQSARNIAIFKLLWFSEPHYAVWSSFMKAQNGIIPEFRHFWKVTSPDVLHSIVFPLWRISYDLIQKIIRRPHQHRNESHVTKDLGLNLAINEISRACQTIFKFDMCNKYGGCLTNPFHSYCINYRWLTFFSKNTKNYN